MLATYHNHTTFSDGRATVAETVASAQSMGIGELGFSDHYVVHADGRAPKWAMRRERLSEYIEAISAARQSCPEIEIRIGLEVDWFPGQFDHIEHALKSVPLDYVIGSVHECHGFPVDGSPEPWKRLDEAGRNEVHRSYWRLITEMASTGLFDLIAHIDLPKKFGFLATTNLDDEIDAALDAIASGGQVVEINTAGWHKPCADAYPTQEILARCHARGIPVTLSADSHRCEHLLRDFRAAADRLRGAGYTQVARIGTAELRFDTLDDAVRGIADDADRSYQDGW